MRPLRIAIAEDNWFIAEYLCGELAALGHAIVGRARTGEELIDLVAHERPDLALADVRLAGGSDGLAAAKEVQERFDVPAIAATGHLTAAEAEAAGLLAILSKPLRRTPCGQSSRRRQHRWKRLEQTMPEALTPGRRQLRQGFCGVLMQLQR
jgi:CheY-like chemotaxis protein